MTDASSDKLDSATPAVSWLLCTHVADDQLRQALASCLNQTFSDFELLVVTNGPAAESVANAVRQWHMSDPRVRVLATEVRHLTFSLALGLHEARAPLIARMDGDDISAPRRLALQTDYMRAHPDVVVLGTAFELIDSHGAVLETRQLPRTDGEIRRALYSGNPMCHPAVMFRRTAVLAAGGYLGGIYGQDYDLWARLAVDPANHFANLPDVCVSYRVTGVGTARKARWSYASAAASQYRNFVVGAGLRWGWGALLNTLKAFTKSNPVRSGS